MVTYRVKAGDTLGKIAKRFYGDPARYTLIVQANTLTNPDKLKVGQVLAIPDLATPPPPAAPASKTAQLNAKRLAQLHPIVAVRGTSMLELCAQDGLAILVTQGLRTWEEQDQLYAQGRTSSGKVVTNAKGGESYHNFGLAFDIVVLDSIGKANWDDSHPGWAKAAKLAKSVGLEWGGDWKKFKDLPHFQYTAGLKTADCRKLYANGGGFAAVWAQVVCIALLLCGGLAPQPAGAQDLRGAIAGAQRELRGFLLRCDTTARLKGTPGGGEFKLSHAEPVRLPYGVRYRFQRRVAAADFVFLTLEVESRGDLAEPRQTVQAEAVPGDAACFQAMLPALPVDRAVTLRQTTVARLAPERRAKMRDALDGLQAAFLRELDAGTFGPAAALHRLDSAIAAVYPRLVDTSAFAGSAVVQVASGRPAVVALADTIRTLFLASAAGSIDVPAIASRGHDLAVQLETVAAGRSRCDTVALGIDRTGFQALVGHLAPLRNASTAADIAPLYARAGGVLPLSASDVTNLLQWLDAACRGRINQTALDGLAAVARELGRDPLGPLLDAVAAARWLVDETWTVTSYDAFGGATTTLQRYGQIDVVNAYLPARDEARVLVTFSFYPLKRRYGGERLPHDFGDQLVLSVGYSVATAVADSTTQRRVLTAGVMLRFNAALAVGGGVALIDRRSYGYTSLSFDLANIPGLAQLFARPGL